MAKFLDRQGLIRVALALSVLSLLFPVYFLDIEEGRATLLEKPREIPSPMYGLITFVAGWIIRSDKA